ncbi:hypothetical protein [uncultured Hoeflea sp.]|uniref:hypothetical protein n=1 Tax=uncultured Hoeflea sp. TaxID=538666 RepID=UPI0026185E3B|nr:hypothetical protein [uncultured Hoeflea sp.]
MTVSLEALCHVDFVIVIDLSHVISLCPISSEDSPIGAKSALSGALCMLPLSLIPLPTGSSAGVSKKRPVPGSIALKQAVYSRIPDQAMNSR